MMHVKVLIGSLVSAFVLSGCVPATVQQDTRQVEPATTGVATGSAVTRGAATTLSGSDRCPLGPAVETGGQRRLALIVGVGDYKSNAIADLPGASGDAKRMYELLTSADGGYGFPKENVCLLLSEQATAASFKAHFEQVLVERAQADDVALLYYAGHGSHTRDLNRDEPDGRDETYLFHDARTGGVSDMLDDEVNDLLRKLHGRTRNGVVILDSCNSGSATRGGPGASGTIARFVRPASEDELDASTGGDGWAPAELPGFVWMTAAKDGTSAIEKDGHGIFTDALIAAMTDVGSSPLTYAQVGRKVPPMVAVDSYQIPFFQGALDKVVFANRSIVRPRSWDVRKIERDELDLSGVPLPGMGVGAELRVYDRGVSSAAAKDPGQAKATVVVTGFTGQNAKARVSAARPGSSAIELGDMAVLVRPSDAALKVGLRIRPQGEPGGIPGARARSIASLIEADPDASAVVEMTNDNGEFELSLNQAGQVVLAGPENRVRITYEADTGIPGNLWQHARQRALLSLRGEGGGDFVDHETLRVRLVPARKQPECARGQWDRSAAPNGEQTLPLCHNYNVEIALSRDAPKPLLVGAVVASTDGGTYGLPADGRRVLLKAGQKVVFNGRRETFRAQEPLDTWDHVVAFGTQQTNPVRWDLMTADARVRGTGAQEGGLSRALNRYISGPNTRGAAPAEAAAFEDTTWTLSAMKMRTAAN